MPESRLPQSFFTRDVLTVAPELLGNYLVRKFNDGSFHKFLITETEAYRGEEDLACHASKGRTARTEIMYHEGGHLYVYLIYGMYWMLNIVTGTNDNPQAILIRGIEQFDGPGKLTKHLQIDKSFYGENLINSERIWIEPKPDKIKINYLTSPRIGIDYSGDIWKNKPWRFLLKD
jgi:DNA-3-methyladenine glycosylase